MADKNRNTEYDELDDEFDVDDYDDDEDADDYDDDYADAEDDDEDDDEFDYSFDFLPDDEQDDDADDYDDEDDEDDADDYDGDDYDDYDDEDDDADEGDDYDDEDDAEDDEDDDTPKVFDRAYVEKLRRENAHYRTRYKEARAETQDVLTPILSAVGSVLGDDFDIGESTADDIAEALTSLPKQAAEEARTARIEAAVYKHAADAGIDVETAMDSRKFYDTVTKLDPRDEGFDKKVRDALKTVPQAAGNRRSAPPARSGGDFTSGNRATSNNDMSFEALRSRRRKRRGVN